MPYSHYSEPRDKNQQPEGGENGDVLQGAEMPEPLPLWTPEQLARLRAIMTRNQGQTVAESLLNTAHTRGGEVATNANKQ